MVNVETTLRTIASTPVFSQCGQIDVMGETIIPEFNASKQTLLFRELKRREFSGQLILQDNRGIESILHFYLGRLIYATGGIHPMRRWQRHLRLLRLDFLEPTLQQTVSLIVPKRSQIGWQYEVLCEWGRQKNLSLEELTRLIKSIVSEVLFDLTQAGEVTYRCTLQKQFSEPLVVIDPEQIVVEVWKQWQAWESAKLGDRFPNSAPIVKNRSELAKRVTPDTFRFLSEYLDSHLTLRDLALQLQQDVLQLTRSLMIYVQLGLLDLISIADLSDPFDHSKLPSCPLRTAQRPLVAYVEGQLSLGEWIQQIMETAGYEFLHVQDGLQAIAYFLQRKPDLIFLTSQMQTFDGYTICRELRQSEEFRYIPIIIITNHLNMIERIRAKMAGASELLSQAAFIESIHQLIAQFSITN